MPRLRPPEVQERVSRVLICRGLTTLELAFSVMALSDDADPTATAVEMTTFFADRVPGQLGCVFDHAAKDLVVGHIDVTASLIAGTGFPVCARRRDSR